MHDKRYLTCAETAVLLRQQLKRCWPTIKFSVRSKVYSGGASINVRYQDGPPLKAVERIAGQFAGSQFDGMIDLRSGVCHWLLPDGSVRLASAEGTTGSGGVIPSVRATVVPADAQHVHLLADYVFVQRDYSEQAMARIKARIDRKYGIDWTRDLMVWRDGWLELDGYRLFGEATEHLDLTA